jgi:excinuclease UvrABC ATPase subunit
VTEIYDYLRVLFARVRYELQAIGRPTLEEVLAQRFG